jgi:hypothetical protein
MVHRPVLVTAGTEFNKHPMHFKDGIASANDMDSGSGRIASAFDLRLGGRDIHKTLNKKISCQPMQKNFQMVNIPEGNNRDFMKGRSIGFE